MALEEVDIEGLKAMVFVNDALVLAIGRAMREIAGVRAHFDQLCAAQEAALLGSEASDSQIEAFREVRDSLVAAVWGEPD